ncbi:hypothetical protein ACQ4M3_06835 [Leptolyngbya sp. AN03gr2]|uniref:hypothetical protein n=1 Tax=unclassified Leptolyngbya TaxID=2650499 RepID=UPI003D31638C
MPELQTWEFLIQLDGDRAWLPLEGSNVEILEGRYRIAAKTNRRSTPVEVRIRYDAIDEVPPKRRTQTRTHQTNPKGLMPVIPYTRLQSGIWEFRCAAPEGEAHSIQLRVLSIESDIVEDWNPDWELEDQTTFDFPASASVTESKVIDADRASLEEFLQQADQDSSSIADDILTEYGLIAEESYEEDKPPQVARFGDSEISIEQIQETYIANRGEPLTISGQITATELTHLDGELRICLRDPQTSRTLLDTHEILNQASLPFNLVYRVTLPVELETQLILGEITLHDVQVEGKPIIATQSFTLMSDVNELLDAMQQARKDDRAMAEDMLDLPATNPAVPQSLNLAFLNLIAAPKNPEAANFASKESQTLPPQLHQPNPYARKKLDLPNFGVQPDGAFPDPDARQLEIPLTDAPAPPEAPVEEPKEEPKEEPVLAPVEEPIAELKVQADDRDLLVLDEISLDLQPSPDQVIDEFVVDDEPILPLTDLIVSRRQTQSDRAQNPLLLPEDQPVPDPIVTLSESELTRGATTIARIKLPDILPKIYVKAWISDRQSRSLVEPPRWIIDFKPDGHGKLEATTEIKVPFDSVEIRIEAIAVEVMTNRESRKVVVDRVVISEEMPDLWLDDFDADSIVSP